MWQKLSIVVGVFLHVVTFANGTPLKSSEAPIITPYAEEITGSFEEQKVFTCRSSEPIVWLIPSVQMSDNHYYINDSKTTENGIDTYESKLTLRYLNQRHVGFYSCVKSKKESAVDQSEQMNDATKFYLFVDDPYDPTVYTYPIAEDKVHAHKNQEVIIPCKPSLKSTEITLVKYPPVRVIVSGEDKTPPVVQPEFASFDPKYGFRISKYDNSMRGLYKCSSPTFIAAPGGSNAKSYELHGDAPVVTPAKKNVTVASGESYKFTCESDEPITWRSDQKGNKGVNENTKILHTQTENQERPFQSTIEMSNIDENFAGFYECKTNASIFAWASPADTNQMTKIKLIVKA